MVGATIDDHTHGFGLKMKEVFEMSMIGELTYFLGLKVQQFIDGIFVTQTKYDKDLVKKFGLDGKSHVRTPMSTNVQLSIDPSGTSVDQTLFCSMIRSLLHLIASHLIYFLHCWSMFSFSRQSKKISSDSSKAYHHIH